jgi:hypothetical protein
LIDNTLVAAGQLVLNALPTERLNH